MLIKTAQLTVNQYLYSYWKFCTDHWWRTLKRVFLQCNVMCSSPSTLPHLYCFVYKYIWMYQIWPNSASMFLNQNSQICCFLLLHSYIENIMAATLLQCSGQHPRQHQEENIWDTSCSPTHSGSKNAVIVWNAFPTRRGLLTNDKNVLNWKTDFILHH